MGAAYAATDLVISRSGAMAIAELCVTKSGRVCALPLRGGRPSTANAQSLVNKGRHIDTR